MRRKAYCPNGARWAGPSDPDEPIYNSVVLWHMYGHEPGGRRRRNECPEALVGRRPEAIPQPTSGAEAGGA